MRISVVHPYLPVATSTQRPVTATSRYRFRSFSKFLKRALLMDGTGTGYSWIFGDGAQLVGQTVHVE